MYNTRTQLRMIRPVADKEKEVKRAVKVCPNLLLSPDPNCFPPNSRKITNIRRRIKDRVSKDVVRILAPDLQSQESEEDFRYQSTKHLDKNRVDCQKKQAMAASPNMKFVFGPVEDPDAPLHADATLGSDMQLTCTRRRYAPSNVSSNIKSVLEVNEDKEKTKHRMCGNPCDDKRCTRPSFSLTDDNNFVWHPSYRVPNNFLMAEGFRDPRSEYYTMATHQQKQNKQLSYKNSHWRSTVFSAPEKEERPPYEFNDIIGGGPCDESMGSPMSRVGLRRLHYRNVESAESGLTVLGADKTGTEKSGATRRIEEGHLHNLRTSPRCITEARLN